MADWRQTVRQASAHLRDMTLSQRLAVLLGVLLVAGSLAWMIQWAASPEYVPLLNQVLTPEELARLSEGLDLIDQRYRIAGAQILVPASANRPSILARLQQADKLPSDTSIGFEELVKQSNPWISQAENNRRWTLAMQRELERVLRRFNGVQDASVFLNLNAQRVSFGRQPEHSASVTLTMTGGAPVPRELAISAARLVAGAVRGLTIKNVEVVDSNGRPAIDWESEQSGTLASIERRRRQQEQDTAAKIRSQLAYIPGVRVSVQVVLDPTTRHVEASTVSEGAALERRGYEEENSNTARSGQAGVQPNTGTAVAGGTRGQNERREEREERFQPSVTQSSESTPAGRVQSIYAAISIPYSYLAGIYRRNNPDGEEPNEQQIERIFEGQAERIVRQVTKLVYPTDPEQVAVDWHYDVVQEEQTAEAGSAGSSLRVVRTYGPVGALAALAVLALFLTLRMARQGSETPSLNIETGLPEDVVEAARRAAQDLKRAAQAPAAGVATSSETEAVPLSATAEGMLEAPELDEQAVQMHKMLEQVGRAIQADPKAVAGLIERWLHQR